MNNLEAELIFCLIFNKHMDEYVLFNQMQISNKIIKVFFPYLQ